MRKRALEDELDEIMEDVRSVIVLTGKLIVFLEPPQSEVWELIKPILSHDKEEIELSFCQYNHYRRYYYKESCCQRVAGMYLLQC